jgi:hypothetical protein
MLLLGDTLSGQGGLAHALAPLDRHHDSLQRPDSPAGFLESRRGHWRGFGPAIESEIT